VRDSAGPHPIHGSPLAGIEPVRDIPQSQNDFGVALQLPRSFPPAFVVQTAPRKLPLVVGTLAGCLQFARPSGIRDAGLPRPTAIDLCAFRVS
jgi:hypothetical protein